MRLVRLLAGPLLLAASLSASLAACATTSTARTAASTPTPSATPGPMVLPVSPADPAQVAVACGSTADQAANYTDFVRAGDLYLHKLRIGSAPGDQLPDGTPATAPFKVDVPLSVMPWGNVSSQLAAGPAVNPGVDTTREPYTIEEGSGAIAFNVCNGNQAQVHVITGTLVRVDTVTPYAGSLNAWGGGCDAAYGRGATYGFGGPGPVGCPFGFMGQAYQHATFAGAVQPGTAVSAVPDPVRQTGGPGPSVALPVTLTSGKTVTFSTGVTFPRAPATYTISVGLSVDHQAVVWMPLSQPILLAPVARKWSGAGCTTPAMQAQIPAATDPPTYYVCPVQA